ncbi:HAD family hydrolase [Aquibacillus rhizosphaerae]|uniref:HAD family hydrolase n=1 Tax=Aquibacillus rhizosphaerae TaxID=3051431 RepID=A0ABT7LBE5_9BACI|nr:HAD family hydrolase [Aquibacillus sp. LR5S19]MDL4841866.1 HAD family hydrolase [Aquibacillus sp. LR5S19]
MLKLFATDLDGTLLGHGNHIDEKDINAINSLVENKIEFTIATGRMNRDITEIVKLIKQKSHRVSQNGGFVHDKEGQLIYSQTFTGELSKRIHNAISNSIPLYCVSTADDIFVSEKTGIIQQLEHLLYFPLKEGVNFSDQYGSSIHPAKFMILGETDEISKQKDLLMKQFESEVEAYLSDNHCVDIVPKGISKALGLSHLIKILEINPVEIAVIGDSFNDIPMLEMTPLSYAMASAHPDVQRKASKVVNHVHEAITDLKNQGLY